MNISDMLAKELETPKNSIAFCHFARKRLPLVAELEDDLLIETLKGAGFPIFEKENKICLRTYETDIKDETFCVVDIETNGNSPKSSQIIEIGAIKYKNNQIIDRFESFIFADYVPLNIESITGINQKDLQNAPNLKNVLIDFKIFLADSVFLAHNVNFDYKFISESLEKEGLFRLLNRKICTIDLAKKTIPAQRYGLKHLIEILEINSSTHHRAYADALSALEVFKKVLQQLPDDVKNTEDLIGFSRFSKKQKKEKERQNKLQKNDLS